MSVQGVTKQSEQLEHLPLDVKSDGSFILNKHCLLRITGGTLKFSAELPAACRELTPLDKYFDSRPFLF
jgi:hypothetical protein